MNTFDSEIPNLDNNEGEPVQPNDANESDNTITEPTSSLPGTTDSTETPISTVEIDTYTVTNILDAPGAGTEGDVAPPENTDSTAATTSESEERQFLRQLEADLFSKEEDILFREQLLEKKQSLLAEREDALKKLQLSLAEQELRAKTGFMDILEERFATVRQELEERESKLLKDLEQIEKRKEELSAKELELKRAELERINNYATERSKFDQELADKKTKQQEQLIQDAAKQRLSLENELFSLRSKKLSELEEEIKSKRESEWQSLRQFEESLNSREALLNNREIELQRQAAEQSFKEKLLDARDEDVTLSIKKLDKELEERIKIHKTESEKDINELHTEIARLRESIRTSNSLMNSYEELKKKLGGEDAAAVLLKLKSYERSIKELREELTTRPTAEMIAEFERIKAERDTISTKYESMLEENKALKDNQLKSTEFELEIADLTQINKSLESRLEAVSADNDRLQEEVRRFHNIYKTNQDRVTRIKSIEEPYFKKEMKRDATFNEDIQMYATLVRRKATSNAKGEMMASEEAEELSRLKKKFGDYELEWLNNISKSCSNYGLVFPNRILKALHTSLKIAEWSPITVLAGVSGTGKSELPRLYSHFGGINFLSLPVQPNWDSQESMLGFFNSIDDSFDAQPVLRLLAQTQIQKSKDYIFGLQDTINIILLDEMNLAHIELYFAEFLSKLEMRRGNNRKDVQKLLVKLGSNIDPYELPLGRNVLWVGTMNQDETTKSLSDKVLDRGIIINFPRPTKLERRKKLKPLPEQTTLLPKYLWDMWISYESLFSEDQIKQYKDFIERLNSSLSLVGRALGHRVWQSIEYYMSNYPDVLSAYREGDNSRFEKAMKTAFEDQLVQKVMPKLRGIETRGKSKTECLEPIGALLVEGGYSIKDDFDLAMEFGYGQFIWNSANYIKEDDNMLDEVLSES